MIRKLYKASQAGVKIELIIRGDVQTYRGLEGLSENITLRTAPLRTELHEPARQHRRSGFVHSFALIGRTAIAFRRPVTRREGIERAAAVAGRIALAPAVEYRCRLSPFRRVKAVLDSRHTAGGTCAQQRR